MQAGGRVGGAHREVLSESLHDGERVKLVRIHGRTGWVRGVGDSPREEQDQFKKTPGK